MAALAPHANVGSAVLHAWARGAGQGALGAPEMLAVLTARHRRASPPSLAEQPRMSLQTRRDYHEFLTMPINRQALTVGIGRIVENPIDQAILVLLKSDVDGQGRVQEALRSWPLSLRRRISARFWRAQRDERERLLAEKAARRRQSHKYRRVQSHEYRSRIS